MMNAHLNPAALRLCGIEKLVVPNEMLPQRNEGVPPKNFAGLHTLLDNNLRENNKKTWHTDNMKSMQACIDYCNSNESNLRTSIAKFSNALKTIHSDTQTNLKLKPSYKNAKENKNINYVEQLNRHVNEVINNQGTITHDIDIVLSETLCFLTKKLSRSLDKNNGDQKIHNEIAEKIVKALYDNFKDYFAQSHTYNQVFPPLNKSLSYSSVASNADTPSRVIKGMLEQINKQQNSSSTDGNKVSNIYIEAGQLCVKADKPKFNPYNPTGERFDRHSHQHNNYDTHQLVNGKAGAAWAVKQAMAEEVSSQFIMPIPHTSVLKEEKSGNLYGNYYRDWLVKECKHANHDVKCHEDANALNETSAANRLIPTSTGIPITTDLIIEDAKNYAKQYAKNCAKSHLAAGKTNIGVVFGELTSNKIQLPQVLPGCEGDKPFKETMTAILTAIYQGAYAGLQEAAEEFPKITDQVHAQVLVVFHNDTDSLNLDGSKLKREVLTSSCADKAQYDEIEQPTINDVLKYIKDINSNLEGSIQKIDGNANSNTAADKSRVRVENVLQLAHLVGVTPDNFKAKEANSQLTRTNDIYNLLTEARGFQSLRVITDTSWLTAAARYSNQGMGDFLKNGEADPQIKDIGKRMILADNIANDGFMFFSGGERHFQNLIAAGDNSPETLHGMALMRASIEKVFQSYYQEIGGIAKTIKDKPELGKALMGVIKNDAKKEGGLTEGNFIGLLYKLYKNHSQPTDEKKGQVLLHDAMPVGFGSDGLTQFAERSGAEKYKLYRDQLVSESLIELTIEALRKTGGKADLEDATDLENILTLLRTSSEQDKKFFDPANRPKTISTDNLEELKIKQTSVPPLETPRPENPAANNRVQLGSRSRMLVTSAWQTKNNGV